MYCGIWPGALGHSLLIRRVLVVLPTCLFLASATPFCCGVPGLENVTSTWFFLRWSRKAAFKNSPPLSQ